MAAHEINLPVIGKVPSTWVWVGAGAVALIVGWAYLTNKGGSQAPAGDVKPQQRRRVVVARRGRGGGGGTRYRHWVANGSASLAQAAHARATTPNKVVAATEAHTPSPAAASYIGRGDWHAKLPRGTTWWWPI